MRGIRGMRGKHQIARIARVLRNREIPGWVPLILEFRGKFLQIARDIARKISWIAHGIARQLLGIRGELRGFHGKFYENSLKYCVILDKFTTNFKGFAWSNCDRNIKFKSLLPEFTFRNILQEKNKKNFVISLQLPKNNYIIWEKITGLRGNCAGFHGMRGKHQIARIARVSRNREIPGWVLRELGHCPIISHYKAESLSFGIVAIGKKEKSRQNTVIYYMQINLKEEIKLHVYYQRTESILNSSEGKSFEIQIIF